MQYSKSFEWLSDFIRHNSQKPILLFDKNTEKYCSPLLPSEILNNSLTISLDPGESSKSIVTAELIWKTLIDNNVKKSQPLICVGGGVITDLGGFIASAYKRGMPLIHIPTSLLAMVDASIGGKNGVNVNSIKNQIGTYYQATEILVNPLFLETLPKDEWRSGYTELLKQLLIEFTWNDCKAGFSQVPYVLSELDEPLLKQAIRVKEEIVERDPKEHSERKKLNLGHTIGHAIEGFLHSKSVSIKHGDAIAWGIILEFQIANKLFENQPERADISAFFKKNYPKLPNISVDQLKPFLLADKKNDDELINFSLLKKPGEVLIDQKMDIDRTLSLLNEAIEEIR